MTKMLSEIKEQPEVLGKLEEINRNTLRALTDELKAKNIKRVLFAARGTSYHACVYGQYLLAIRQGIAAAQAMPSCITLYGSSLLTECDLVIGVSQSGKAADALAVLEDAQKHGAVTAAITNDPESPMAKFAGYHLYCGAGEEISVAATKTFTAQMGLLLLLCAYWNGDEPLLRDFAALPRAASETLAACASGIDGLTLRYRYMEQGFVISRGLTYPIALEAALKTQETCYVKMKGYSAADFYHGPLAQVDSETPVIIFAPRGNAQKDNLELAGRIREIGAQPLVVTDEKTLAEKDPLTFLLPDTGSQFTSPFVFALFAQCFAQSLCTRKGLDPDRPRNLKKVTITK